MNQPLSRRDVLTSGVLATASAAASSSAIAAPSHLPAGYDPRTSSEGQIKLLAALDGSPAYWTYSGLIYAVLPGRHPQPILALSGGQASRVTRRTDGSYIATGSILTFFRDVNTGAFLDSFDNPLTHKRDRVEPNILTGGHIVYPADGGSASAEGQIMAATVAPDGFKRSDPAKPLGVVRWSVIGPSVMLMTDRSWSVATQPQLEAQTQIGDRAAFFDRKVLKMHASFTATTIMPWMTWMDMGETPGHLMWHSSGEKVFSVEEVPADYRAHAGSKLDVLTTPPA